MLDNPEVIKAINTLTVPVNPITPDVVLPDKPIFDQARHYLETYPFGRSNFAWYLFADPQGENILGTDEYVLSRVTAGKPPFDERHFYSVLERASRIVEIGATESPELVAEREKLLEEARQEVLNESMSVTRDTRIMTVWWLSKTGNRPLAQLVDRLINEPSVFAPGVKNLVTIALGEIVIADRPLLPVHVPVLKRLFDAELEAEELSEAERTWAEDDYIPLFYRRKAAETLKTLLELEFDDKDRPVVDAMKRWWLEHRNDPRFQERPSPGDHRLIAR